MKTIDTRGHLCPTPLIMTKRAVNEATVGEKIEVLSDNDTAKCNLLDYIGELGYKADCTNIDGLFKITFSIDKAADNKRDSAINSGSSEPILPSNDNNPSCPISNSANRNYAVVIKSEKMGDGNDDLGLLLMRACINSLSELDELPLTILIYNGGVMLAVKGTDTALSLQKLQSQGVEIIICGTCVDFYNIKDKIAVGNISNMLKINTILSQTDHIVYP